MQRIQISVTNDAIFFTSKNTPETNPNLTNSNFEKDKDMVFTPQYLKGNLKSISSFIEELCQEKNIYRATIDTYELALFLMDLLNKNSYITAICIREKGILPYTLYEKVIENKNINYIEAHSIQPFMLEMFDKNGIHAEARSEVFYPSSFMQNNNLTNFSKIFYQMNIRINEILTEEDRDDFFAFCNLNNYLKTIHLDVYVKKDLEYILEVLNENRIKNIRILIYADIKDYKTIDYLKRLNKKIKKNKIHISLVYSKEYLSNNLFMQILMNMLKVCGVLAIIIVLTIIGYIGVSNYMSLQQVTQMQEDIKVKIEKTKEEDLPEIENITGKEIQNNYIVSLLSMNQDAVGWLRVNNTSIDYPVVQSHDNDYYLKHNIFNEEDKNGWIFMDYRNSTTILDSNTIIYGHNMYYSDVMFGTLSNVYKKTWYENPENLVISFDTIYESNKYQIFSIYKTPKTKDYLKTYFANDDEFNEFIHLIQGRSIEDFGVEVTPSDKLLTLSTCTGENQRLVVHAKLITPESD